MNRRPGCLDVNVAALGRIEGGIDSGDVSLCSYCYMYEHNNITNDIPMLILCVHHLLCS